MRVAARLFLAFLVCAVVCAASGARAAVRFGDTTWVAPNWPADDGYTNDSVRVAPPDSERGWETALRTPFRLVFLPIRLVAMGLEAGVSYIGPRYLAPKPKRPPEPGLKLAPKFRISAIDNFGIGPALTWTGFPTEGATLSLSGTWTIEDGRRVRLTQIIGDRRPVGLRLAASYDYKSNRRYYGIGNETPETGLSYYRLADTRAEGALLLGASPLRQLRIGGGYSSMSPGPGYHGSPSLGELYTPDAAPYQSQGTRDLWYGVAADFAALDDDRDPSFGAHARVDLRRAAGLEAGDPDYTLWRAEGRVYAPVFAKRRVIAVRGVYTGVEPDGGATTIMPFYRLPGSESASRFAGYNSGRFRDRQLMLVRIEYRWMVLSRLSALALYEQGAVAPSMNAFRLGDTHASYGGGLRFGYSDKAVVRGELAKSVEGFEVVLSLWRDF